MSPEPGRQNPSLAEQFDHFAAGLRGAQPLTGYQVIADIQPTFDGQLEAVFDQGRTGVEGDEAPP